MQSLNSSIQRPCQAEHNTDEWQAAMQVLLLVAEDDGPPMFARIGVIQGNQPSRCSGD
jgi:hypothetical protein